MYLILIIYTYWSLNFFFLSAGASSLFFMRFSKASGIGRSEMDVTWESS